MYCNLAILLLSTHIYVVILKLEEYYPEERGYPMEDKINRVLTEKVNPLLASHFGGVVLTAFENGIAYVKLTGSCSTCPSAQYTIEDVVKGIVMEEISEVKDVILDTSVSEDLLDMARKLLKK